MADKKVQVLVIYTHNVSRAIRVHELPKPGETVRSIGYSEGIDGAKGTDVAIALGRLGIPTALVAYVRQGDWLEQGHALLDEAGVDDRFITSYNAPMLSRGTMLIDDQGNNMIVLSSGHLDMPTRLIDEALGTYVDAEYCVTGYELGEEGVATAIKAANLRGLKTLVNPSPVPDAIPDYWDKVDVIVLNELELARLLDDEHAASDAETTLDSIRLFRDRSGCGAVVLTLGDRGYVLLDGDAMYSEPGMNVERVIDTSGAGDGFMAALTACLAKGMTMEKACSWANRYSSISIQRDGTITCYPTLEEAEQVAGALAR